ncbi:MAG TPA: hypothetical protein VFZ91_01385 [Allosphingosinicella sp.]
MIHTAASCREKAARFRELAEGTGGETAAALLQLAEDYEAEADRLEPDSEPPMPPAA